MPYSKILNQAQYMSLTTYRKSGVGVSTPLWCAGDDRHYYLFSAPLAGKVKRLKNSSKAALAACNFKGDTYADYYPASAELLASVAEIKYAHQVLSQKYGWKLFITDLASRLTGKLHRRQYIRISLSE